MSNFDRMLKEMNVDRGQFDRTNKLMTRSIGAIIFIWLVSLVVGIGGTGLLIWVAWHFISNQKAERVNSHLHQPPWFVPFPG